MRKPKRLYTAADVATGVQVVHGLGLKALAAHPAPGPLMAAQQATQSLEPAPEMAEGHCTGCKGKKQFQVVEKVKMKNGAMNYKGPCAEPGCGRTISTFVKGATDAPAA